MKGDALYWLLAAGLRRWVWGGELIEPEHLPGDRAVVYVSNHAAALGPIAVFSTLPFRVHPWVISDMMEWDRSAEYLCRDFVEPQLHVPAWCSGLVSRLISQISVRLFRAVGCIPVWHGENLSETYRISIGHLLAGRCLLIFPEDPSQPMNQRCRMSPFYKGFTRLGEMYYARTGDPLRFCPVAVHPLMRKMKIGRPVLYNPRNDPVRERLRLKRTLESAVQTLYLEIEPAHHAGLPLPE